jgi:hypothetical protein
MPGSFKERNLGLLRVKRLRLLETWVMWEKINVPENRRLRSADFTPEQGPLQWRLRY